jgi:hypothetical protein
MDAETAAASTLVDIRDALNSVLAGVPWREVIKTHPSADVWPMLPEDEQLELDQDIETHGLKEKLTFTASGLLLDGRNRLEAISRRKRMPRIDKWCGNAWFNWPPVPDADSVATVISLNAHRRHLTKLDKARMIVAAQNPASVGEVYEEHRGGRSKKNPAKARAVAEGAKHNIGTRTIERAIAEAKGKKPKAKAPAQVLDAEPKLDIVGRALKLVGKMTRPELERFCGRLRKRYPGL